jgi:RES domain-containing protein
MDLATLQYAPELELPQGATLYRVQLSRARKTSQRIGPLCLAPIGTRNGRFDLAAEPVAYLAESPETALYEAVFRREVTAVSLSLLAQRSLLSLTTERALKLLDLRGHARAWPVLQSLRFSQTQALAADIRQQGCDGLIYRSAQHHGQDCHALFGPALSALKRRWSQPLVDPLTGGLHRLCAAALTGSQIPLHP